MSCGRVTKCHHVCAERDTTRVVQGGVEHELDLLVLHGPSELSKLAQPSLEEFELRLCEELGRSECRAALLGQLEPVDIGKLRCQSLLVRIAFLRPKVRISEQL